MNDQGELVGYYVAWRAYCVPCSPTNDPNCAIYWHNDPIEEVMFCADCEAPLVPAEEEPPEERPRKDDPPDNVKDDPEFLRRPF